MTVLYRFVHTWGELNRTTKLYTGMMGDLQTGAAALAGSTVFMTPSRVALFEYSSMINPTVVRFVFRPPPLTYVANVYALPFAAGVWLAAAAIVGLALLVVFAACRWGGDNDERRMSSVRVSGSDVLLMGMGALAQMGTTLEARQVSMKIAMVRVFIVVIEREMRELITHPADHILRIRAVHVHLVHGQHCVIAAGHRQEYPNNWRSVSLSTRHRRR